MNFVRKKLGEKYKIRFSTKNLKTRSQELVQFLNGIPLYDPINQKSIDVFHKNIYLSETPILSNPQAEKFYLFSDMMNVIEFRSLTLHTSQVINFWEGWQNNLNVLPSTLSNVNNQIDFIKQIRPVDENKAYKRYKKFLYLQKYHNPKDFKLIPTYDIDIIWRTHILHPKNYYIDCRKYFGYLLERTNYSYVDFEKTKNLWEKVFHEEY